MNCCRLDGNFPTPLMKPLSIRLGGRFAPTKSLRTPRGGRGLTSFVERDNAAPDKPLPPRGRGVGERGQSLSSQQHPRTRGPQ